MFAIYLISDLISLHHVNSTTKKMKRSEAHLQAAAAKNSEVIYDSRYFIVHISRHTT